MSKRLAFICSQKKLLVFVMKTELQKDCSKYSLTVILDSLADLFGRWASNKVLTMSSFGVDILVFLTYANIAYSLGVSFVSIIKTVSVMLFRDFPLSMAEPDVEKQSAKRLLDLLYA